MQRSDRTPLVVRVKVVAQVVTHEPTAVLPRISFDFRSYELSQPDLFFRTQRLALCHGLP